MGSTGGKLAVKNAIKQGIVKTTKEAVKKQLTKTTAKTLLKDSTIGVAKFNAKYLPQQGIKRYGELEIDNNLLVTPEGQVLLNEAETKPATSVLKAMGLMQIETFSETAGYAFNFGGKVLGNFINNKLLKKLPDKFVKNLSNLTKQVTGLSTVKALEKYGWNGILEEYGEERISDLLQTTFDLDDEKGYSFEQFLQALFPPKEQAIAELLSFAIMGGTGAGIKKGIDFSKYKNIANDIQEQSKNTDGSYDIDKMKRLIKRHNPNITEVESCGGNVILKTAPEADNIIEISRNTPQYQSTGYSTSTGFQGSEIEKSFDKVSCNLQEMSHNIEAFKEETNVQVEDFEDEINSKLVQVNEAVEQLNKLEEVAEECKGYAIISEEQSIIAQQQAVQAETFLQACEEETAKAQRYAEQSGSKGMPTDICKNLKIEYDTANRKVKLNWTDPNDTINSLGQILSSWKNTLILCKENDYPSDIDDGTVILTNSVKNQYRNQPYEYSVPENITDIKTLKFRAFPCSVNGVYNKDNRNCFDSIEIYEMLFDKLNSNVFGNVRYPQGCRNEHFKSAGMDYDKNIFDYGSWGDTFLLNMTKPCMLYNKAANNIGLNIVGDLQISDSNFSGFTTAIYADTNYIPEDIESINSFEICADFTTGSTISTGQETILGNSTTNAHSPQLAIISKKLQWDMPNSSYAFIGAMASTNELSVNTHYVSKLKYNKADSLISAYMSTNDGADVKIGEMSVSSIGWNEVIRLGLDLLANPFNGSINIKGCYISINEEKVFDGSKYENMLGQVMEYLNPDDYSQTLDGEASHVSDENSPANAMTEWDIRKTWIKIEEYLPDKYHAYFANKQVDSSYKNILQFNKNGEIVDKYYHAMYDACVVNGIVRSLSGKTPYVNASGEVQIKGAQANGYGYDTYEARFIYYRQLLLMLIGKSTDSQTVFGKGRNSGGTSTSYNQLTSGTLDKKGAFFGDNNNGDVKVYHSASAWGNVWNIMQGLVQKGGKLYIKLTPNTNDGSTAEEYNTTGEGYIDTGITLSGTSGGYISDVELYDNCIFLPKTASGSSSTYIPDGLWWNSSLIGFARCGGSSTNGLLCGSFTLIVNDAVSRANWHSGASLSYISS